jgi:hypothetical protein
MTITPIVLVDRPQEFCQTYALFCFVGSFGSSTKMLNISGLEKF